MSGFKTQWVRMCLKIKIWFGFHTLMSKIRSLLFGFRQLMCLKKPTQKVQIPDINYTYKQILFMYIKLKKTVHLIFRHILSSTNFQIKQSKTVGLAFRMPTVHGSYYSWADLKPGMNSCLSKTFLDFSNNSSMCSSFHAQSHCALRVEWMATIKNS